MVSFLICDVHVPIRDQHGVLAGGLQIPPDAIDGGFLHHGVDSKQGEDGSGASQGSLGSLLALEADPLLLLFSERVLAELLSPGVVYDLMKVVYTAVEDLFHLLDLILHKGDPIRGRGCPGGSVFF